MKKTVKAKKESLTTEAPFDFAQGRRRSQRRHGEFRAGADYLLIEFNGINFGCGYTRKVNGGRIESAAKAATLKGWRYTSNGVMRSDRFFGKVRTTFPQNDNQWASTAGFVDSAGVAPYPLFKEENVSDQCN